LEYIGNLCKPPSFGHLETCQVCAIRHGHPSSPGLSLLQTQEASPSGHENFQVQASQQMGSDFHERRVLDPPTGLQSQVDARGTGENTRTGPDHAKRIPEIYDPSLEKISRVGCRSGVETAGQRPGSSKHISAEISGAHQLRGIVFDSPAKTCFGLDICKPEGGILTGFLHETFRLFPG